MLHFPVLDAEKKVKHKDAYSNQGGKAKCNRGVSLFTSASMKDSRVTIKQEIWRGGACVKDSVRDRSILECVRNNARHHLSKKYFNFNKSPAWSVSHIRSYGVTCIQVSPWKGSSPYQRIISVSTIVMPYIKIFPISYLISALSVQHKVPCCKIFLILNYFSNSRTEYVWYNNKNIFLPLCKGKLSKLPLKYFHKSLQHLHKVVI